jgi:FkbM family methyltransferase
MTLLSRFIGAYYRSGLRGSNRVSDFLSHRFASLQNVPIEVDGGTLYADLRISAARGILAEPRCQSGEDRAMRHLVRPGDAVYDIGAHLGFYTLLLAELVGETGKVCGFEPNPELLPSLKRTLSEKTNVDLFEFALSDSIGTIDLFVPEDATMASLSDWTKGLAGNVYTVSCEMFTIDHLVAAEKIPTPQFIKCDVEGAELSVFMGGMKTLDRVDAPVVLFEVNAAAANAAGTTPEDYFEFFESLHAPDYTFFEVFRDGIKVLASRWMKYANVVAVPRTRLEACRGLFA